MAPGDIDTQPPELVAGSLKLTLLAATDKAVKANSGYRAVSAYPQMEASYPVAEVTLLHGSDFKTVTVPLN